MSDGFLLNFPCFAIMSSNCQGGVILELDTGTAAAVILSDEDLLNRYRIEQKLPGPTVRFDHPGQLALYLDSTPERLTHIAIDPQPGNPTIIPKHVVFRRVLEMMNDDSQ